MPGVAWIDPGLPGHLAGTPPARASLPHHAAAPGVPPRRPAPRVTADSPPAPDRPWRATGGARAARLPVVRRRWRRRAEARRAVLLRTARSITAVHKKMERYAKAAGMKTRGQALRHTFASNLLEYGTELVTVKAFLGHASIASSERYARGSHQKVKQEYLRSL